MPRAAPREPLWLSVDSDLAMDSRNLLVPCPRVFSFDFEPWMGISAGGPSDEWTSGRWWLFVTLMDRESDAKVVSL